MSTLNDLMNQVLAEAAQLKTGVVEKVAAEREVAAPTETGALMRKLAAALRTTTSDPSYAELQNFLQGGA